LVLFSFISRAFIKKKFKIHSLNKHIAPLKKDLKILSKNHLFLHKICFYQMIDRSCTALNFISKIFDFGTVQFEFGTYNFMYEKLYYTYSTVRVIVF